MCGRTEGGNQEDEVLILIQERYKGEPWKLLVGCILCNLTKGSEALKVLDKLFKAYPTPELLSRAQHEDLVAILRPLGFQNRRASTLIKFAHSWSIASQDEYLEDLPGVGKYAVDSYRLFVHDDWTIQPTDKELISYIERNT